MYTESLRAFLKPVLAYLDDDSVSEIMINGPTEIWIERKGKLVHVRMTAIRSHFTPDNIEGVMVGDTVLFHVTNLEQDLDVPHGFAIMGANNAELLVMPGETRTLRWIPTKPGIYPMYCTDFCSALHQEMQGYVRVSPAGSSVALKANTSKGPAAGTRGPN